MPYENKNDEKIVAIVETMAIISKQGFKLNTDYFSTASAPEVPATCSY